MSVVDLKSASVGKFMKKEKQGRRKNPGEMARWYIPLALVDCCDGTMGRWYDGTYHWHAPLNLAIHGSGHYIT